MKLSVTTGQTIAPADTVLLPTVLGDHKGDRVFLLVHIEGNAEGADTLKDECTNVLEHVVLEGSGDAYARLESALKELNGLLKGFLLSDAVQEVHALVGVLEPDGNFHLSHVGRAEGYLIRDGGAAQITEYSRGKPPVAFMHIVSGPLQERDHVVLSTQRLLRAMTPAQLAQVTSRSADVLGSIIQELESEKEAACLAHVVIDAKEATTAAALPRHAGRSVPRRGTTKTQQQVQSALSAVGGMLSSVRSKVPKMAKGDHDKLKSNMKGRVADAKTVVQGAVGQFISDLSDPQRKRRAHLLLLAGGAAVLLILWMVVQLTLSSQKNQSRGELQALMQQINADISTAENRQLAGDTDSANKILQRAQDRAQQVMENESGLFRSEASTLR